MKMRTVITIAVVGVLCLIGEVSPLILELLSSGNGARTPGTSGPKSSASQHCLKGQWLADARTTVAAIHYLLQAEPQVLNGVTVASNNAIEKSGAQDVVLLESSMATRTVANGSENTAIARASRADKPRVHVTPFASLESLPLGMVVSASQLRLADMAQFPFSLPPIPLDHWTGSMTGRSLNIEELDSLNMAEATKSLTTNSHNSSNFPSNQFKLGIIDPPKSPV